MAECPHVAEFQDRLALLTKERNQLEANVVAYNGAIQECEYWIGVVTPKPVPEPEEVEVPPQAPTDVCP